MKKVFLIALICIFSSSTQVSADINLSFVPEPLHGQLWAREGYLLNVTEPQFNLTDYSDFDLSGHLVYNGSIQMKGVGQYHHGSGVTGYSYYLDKSYFQKLEALDGLGTTANVSIAKNAYQYGMKPYEEVQIIFHIDVYLEILENGTTIIGPLIDSKSQTLILVDEEKVDYLKDKYEEMESEINVTLQSNGLDTFDRTRYRETLDDMNHSLAIGDFSGALDQWDRWDSKSRLRMFTSFRNKVNDQTEEFESYIETENAMEILQSEYNFLEDKYMAIFSDYHQNLIELEVTKQGLTTAITGVFLSAIVFFFLGRRSCNGADM